MLRLYNTLTRKKQPFRPARGKTVRLYNCGPTVYDFIHIGNARSAMTYDILRRYLEYVGYRVKHVSNITDVGHLMEGELEDKMIFAAKREKKDPKVIARFYERAFFSDMQRLNILKPHIVPRATEHIKDMIALIQKLIAKGHAYVSSGSVFYSIKTFKEYGKLSKFPIEELRAGARLEPHPDKRDPSDFALWLKAPPGHLMRWKSPWSVGYPGWHIECSAMSLKYLGPTLDIHGGGKDLIFPHHENEIAQSEGATGKKFARFWVHNEWVLLNGQKMSKSKQIYLYAKDAIAKWGPETVRYCLLATHYRSEMNITDESFAAAKEAVKRIFDFVRMVRDIKRVGSRSRVVEAEIAKAKANFEAAMNDDLNTPKALAALFAFIGKINMLAAEGKLTKGDAKEIVKFLTKIDHVLGLLKFMAKKLPLSRRIITTLLKRREALRKAGKFAEADKIRAELREKGIMIEDTPEGPKWYINS